MHFSLKNILVVISLSVFSLAKSQIYAPTADTCRKTSYYHQSKYDSIFIFSVNNPYKEISAHKPDSTLSSFKWLYFDKGYKSLATTSGKYSVIDTITSDMGYAVVIGVDTFRCWVFVQDFDVDITSTRDGDTIPNSDINCRTISYIKADIIDHDFNYCDPYDTAKKFVCKHSYTKVWSSNQAKASAPGPQGSLQVSVGDPYWEDTGYIITVTDKDIKEFKDDTAFYKSVRPHAEFDKPYKIPLTDFAYYPEKADLDWYKQAYDYGEGSGSDQLFSAPGKVKFTNISENWDEFVWIYGDSLQSQQMQSLDSVVHEYSLPGTYFAYLIAKKNVDFLYDPCYDTFPEVGSELDLNFNKIEVSQVQNIDTSQTPNVFTSAHKNPWRFKQDVSIEGIEIMIFNRYGHQVHHFKGNIRDWPGWDGTNNGKGKVSTGVYYFVVKSMRPLPDFESGNLPSELNLVKKGFIHYFDVGN